MTEARKVVMGPALTRVDVEERSEWILASVFPNWEPNTDQDKGALDTYC